MNTFVSEISFMSRVFLQSFEYMNWSLCLVSVALFSIPYGKKTKKRQPQHTWWMANIIALSRHLCWQNKIISIFFVVISLFKTRTHVRQSRFTLDLVNTCEMWIAAVMNGGKWFRRTPSMLTHRFSWAPTQRRHSHAHIHIGKMSVSLQPWAKDNRNHDQFSFNKRRVQNRFSSHRRAKCSLWNYDAYNWFGGKVDKIDTQILCNFFCFCKCSIDISQFNINCAQIDEIHQDLLLLFVLTE